MTQETANPADRGLDGVRYRAPTLEDESYLDFMTGVRNFAINEMFPVLAEKTIDAAKEQGIDDVETCDYSSFAAVADPLPLVKAWKRVMRSQQQMTWNKLASRFDDSREFYEKRLADAEAERPEGIRHDADFKTPLYAGYPIHLQPGGYVGDSLAGYVFDHGTRVFYQGNNEQDELDKEVADTVRIPEDGVVNRVLDVGCSIGQCTTHLAEKFPDAQVTGLDVGLPMVRYAHRRAVDLGVNVQFVHGVAEDLPYPDGSFDAVLAYILFHEVPSRLFDKIIGEVFRVLRPGGTFSIVDAPNNVPLPGPNRMWLAYDAQYNCEPYSPAFVASDLEAMLGNAGFDAVERQTTSTFLMSTTCQRPVG